MLLILLPVALADPPDAAPTLPDPFADCRQLPPELHGLGGEWSAGCRDLFAAVQTIPLDGAPSDAVMTSFLSGLQVSVGGQVGPERADTWGAVSGASASFHTTSSTGELTLQGTAAWRQMDGASLRVVTCAASVRDALGWRRCHEVIADLLRRDDLPALPPPLSPDVAEVVGRPLALSPGCSSSGERGRWLVRCEQPSPTLLSWAKLAAPPSRMELAATPDLIQRQLQGLAPDARWHMENAKCDVDGAPASACWRFTSPARRKVPAYTAVAAVGATFGADLSALCMYQGDASAPLPVVCGDLLTVGPALPATERLDLVLAAAELHGVLRLLGGRYDRDIAASGDLEGRLNLELSGVSADEALTQVAAALSVSPRRAGDWTLWTSPLLPAVDPGELVVSGAWSGCGAINRAQGLAANSPGPASGGLGIRVNLDFARASLWRLLGLFTGLGDVAFTLPRGSLGEVTVVSRDRPWDEVLGAVLETSGLTSACVEQVVVAWDPRVGSDRPLDPWAHYPNRHALLVAPERWSAAERATLLASASGGPVSPMEDDAALVVEGPRLVLTPWSPTPPPPSAPPLRDQPEPATPLQVWEVADYALTAVLTDTGGSAALLEDPEGRSHVVEVGTYVGPYWGKVTSITRQEIVITEDFETLEGELIVNPVHLPLSHNRSGSKQ